MLQRKSEWLWFCLFPCALRTSQALVVTVFSEHSVWGVIAAVLPFLPLCHLPVGLVIAHSSLCLYLLIGQMGLVICLGWNEWTFMKCLERCFIQNKCFANIGSWSFHCCSCRQRKISENWEKDQELKKSVYKH